MGRTPKKFTWIDIILSLLAFGAIVMLIDWLVNSLKNPVFFMFFWFFLLASIGIAGLYSSVRYKARKRDMSISVYLCRKAYLDGENGFVVPKSRPPQDVLMKVLLEEAKNDRFVCENTADLDAFVDHYKAMLEKLEKASMLKKSSVHTPPDLDYQKLKNEFQWHLCDAIKRSKDFKIYEIRTKYKNSREFQEKTLEQFKEVVSGLEEVFSEHTKKYANDAGLEIEQILFPLSSKAQTTPAYSVKGPTISVINTPPVFVEKELHNKNQIEHDAAETGQTLSPIEVTQIEHNAAMCIFSTGMASTSMLQRRFKIGYNEAGKIIDALEEKGIVGPFMGSTPRTVLISEREYSARVKIVEAPQRQASYSEPTKGDFTSPPVNVVLEKEEIPKKEDKAAAESLWRKEKLWPAPVEGLKGMEFPIGIDGKDELVKADFSKINHLLIAGASGTGKSVFLDTLIRELVFNNASKDLCLILCDTKMVDFAPFNETPNMMIPVVSDCNKIAGTLEWAVVEGMKRLETFSSAKAKSISSYNDLAWESFDAELPRIVIVVDDIAEVIPVSQNVKDNIRRILSIGRQAGIHLILSTKMPTEKHLKEIVPQFTYKLAFQMPSVSDLHFLTGKKKGLSDFLDVGEALYCTGTMVMNVRTILSTK